MPNVAATLRDVARLAEVHPGTVSRALNPQTRRLVWSLEARDKGQTDNSQNIVNYKTLMLGREGLVSMNMVSPLATVGTDKTYANLMLSKLDYTQGRKYTDFDAKTDHVAEFGLAALIAGVAVKKLGLIAVIVAFVIKFAKIILVAVAGGLAAFRRFFRRKQPAAAALVPAAPIMSTTWPNATLVFPSCAMINSRTVLASVNT